MSSKLATKMGKFDLKMQKKPTHAGIMKRPASVHSKHSPRASRPLTEKYEQLSQKWSLHFTPGTVRAGLAAIMQANKKKPFLMAGTDPRMECNVIHLTWRVPVTGKYIYMFWRKVLPKTLGPTGHCSPLNFEPSHQFSCVPKDTPHTVAAPAAAIGAAKKGELHVEAYPPLPLEFATASFQSMTWADVGAMKEALDEHGFLILPGYIPEHITKQAFQEATKYFLGVMRSLMFGFSIDKGMAGFDDLASLPSQVWEKQPKKATPITFGEGPFGMQVGPNLEVKNTTHDGQAHCLGVGLGWVLVKFAGKSTKMLVAGQSVADYINEGGQLSEDTELIFQPPTHFSPLAVSQKWGVFSSKGYQPKLGLGKSTNPIYFANCPAVLNAQIWLRNVLSSLHGCLPTELCWQPDGVSFKAGLFFHIS